MTHKPFNLSKTADGNKGAKRIPIRERGINWKEAYHDRSAPLKKRFDKDIGPKSYLRWEGHDYTTNSDYYVVVGPSVQKNVGPMWFAGIKKVPPEDASRDEATRTYSPYGEYFSSINAALSYANRRWAIPIPPNQPSYGKDALMAADIPEHIKA